MQGEEKRQERERNETSATEDVSETMVIKAGSRSTGNTDPPEQVACAPSAMRHVLVLGRRTTDAHARARRSQAARRRRPRVGELRACPESRYTPSGRSGLS